MQAETDKLNSYTKVYLGFMSVLYACVFVMFLVVGIILAVNPAALDSKTSSRPTELIDVIILFSCMLLFIVPLLALYVYTFFNFHKPSKFNYITLMITIVIGFDSILTIIPAVFLFVKWIDPKVRALYFDTEKKS